jgi:hypothetical protein
MSNDEENMGGGKGFYVERILMVFSDIFEVMVEVLEPQLVIIIARSSSEVVFVDDQMTFGN